jgi:ketosteroid isomerase-like protein
MKELIGVTLLLGTMSLGVAQQEPMKPAPQVEKSALQSMIDSELAFARMSAEQGTRPAFVAFIADDGILFRPRAVKGKQWITEHPVPSSDKRPLLSWYPAVADIALAGDMGYTTGPWEFKADIHDAKPVAFGNFLTVWKKQRDGSWKFAIDLGISNPQPHQVAAPWQQPNNYGPMRGGGIGPGVKEATKALLARDREFSTSSATLGALKAFEDYAASEVRMFRNDKQPIVGKADAVAALPASPTVWTWEPVFAAVSHSGDLGYSYGTYKLTSNDATLKTNTVETGNYYRIWKKQLNAWKVVADLLNPVTEDKKN